MSATPFADLTGREDATCLDLQLAIAAEFARADTVATHGLLDDLARALFTVANSHPSAQAPALLRLMSRDLHFIAGDAGEPGDLLLPMVLQTRRGHPLMLAIVACELALRAGIPAAVYSSRTRWFIGLPTTEHLLLLDADLHHDVRPPAEVLAHCRHELAFCALTGLSRALHRRGQLQAARRATTLKLALPICAQLRAEVQRELNAPTRPPAQP